MAEDISAPSSIVLVESLLRERRFQEAGLTYRKMLERNPDDVRILVNYGGVLIELCKFDEAEAVLRQAVSRDPHRAGAWSNLGAAALELQRYDDAIAAFSNAIRIDPSHAAALSGLGVTLRRRGLPIESLAFFDLAVALEPQNAETRHCRALALIAGGDYLRGFAEYEWRWQTGARVRHSTNGLRWRGEPLDGRTLLVHEDGGLGDIIQFARYLPLIKSYGGRVVLRVPEPLMSLLSRMAGVDAVVALGAATPSFDLICPIMSLPHVFATTIEDIPSSGGYLSLDPVIVAVWSERLAADAVRLQRAAPLRVGLIWAGGARPWHREVSLWNDRRSINLAALTPLAEAAPEAVFYSLQIGEAGREASEPPPGMCLIDHTTSIASFDDTAALISLLDLVITVDTSTAHLAGALGCPVWLLSPYDRCWRWLTNRNDSPWYDTMCLYVQQAPFDWVAPVACLAADLADVAQKPGRLRMTNRPLRETPRNYLRP